LLGYEPLVGVEDGLARTWAWFSAAYGSVEHLAAES
jgi:hypothetical protein